MTDRPSLHQRHRALRNLRAGPAFLTPRLVAELLGERRPGPVLMVDQEFDSWQDTELLTMLDAAATRPEPVEPAPTLPIEAAEVEADVEVGAEPEPVVEPEPELGELESTVLEARPEREPRAPRRRDEQPSADRRAMIARAVEGLAAPLDEPPEQASSAARHEAAAEFLRGKAFAVPEPEGPPSAPRYRVGGYRGTFTPAELVVLAQGWGFRA